MFGLEQVSLDYMFAEKMQGSHSMVIFSIEVSNLILEKLNQIQRRELHEEVLDSPFPETFTRIVSFINNLPIHIAPHLCQIRDQRHKLVLKYPKVFKGYLFGFLLRFAFSYIFFNPLEKCQLDAFSEILDEVEEEVEAGLVNFLEVDLQIIDIRFPQLHLHKLHLMQPFASQIAESMENRASFC